MPTFEYQAVEQDGRAVSGIQIAPSIDQAMSALQGKGLQITKIGVAAFHGDPLAGNQVASDRSFAVPVAPVVEQPAHAEGSGNMYSQPSYAETHLSSEEIMKPRSYMATSVWGPLVGKVALSQLLFFFRQLSTMLSAGVPFVQSLDTLASQSRDPKMASVVRELRTHVDAGRQLSFGMQRYPEVFTPVMVSLVRAGEHNGLLDESLALVADYIEKELKLRGIYRRVTFFPKLELVASIIVVLGANAIIGYLNSSAKKLYSPLTDPKVWIILTPIIVVIFLYLRVGLANPRVRYNWDLVISKVPHLGRTLREFSMAKFGRAFGALYKGGVPITAAMALAADSCGNEYLRSKMYPAAKTLEEGKGVAETFRETNAFSPIVMDMVATGETTGNMDHMLTKMSEYYEDEGETRMTQFASVVGIVLAILVCIYIGYVIITFYMGYGNDYQQQINETVGPLWLRSV